MAKKKSASPAATSSPTPSRAVPSKSSATKSSEAKSTAKKTSAPSSASNGDATTATTGNLSAEQIGLTAGSVWGYLTEKGPTSLATIKKEIGASADLVLAAIGWLAREEKLDFTTSGKTVKIGLK